MLKSLLLSCQLWKTYCVVHELIHCNFLVNNYYNINKTCKRPFSHRYRSWYHSKHIPRKIKTCSHLIKIKTKHRRRIETMSTKRTIQSNEFRTNVQNSMVIRRYSSNAIQETRNAYRYVTFPQHFWNSQMNLHYRTYRHKVDAYIMCYIILHLSNSTGWNNVYISTIFNAQVVLGDVNRTNWIGSQTLHSMLAQKTSEIFSLTLLI